MDTKILKNRVKHIARALIALSVLMACAMAAKVSAFVLEAESIPQRIEKALTVDSNKDDFLKEFQVQYAKTAKKLKEKSLFSLPPAVKRNPVTKIDGILGNSALINGKLYKKGDKIGDAKILSIGPKSITVRWDKQDIQVSPFDHTAALSSVKKTTSKPKSKSDKKTVVKDKPKKVKPDHFERPDPREMTPEQREKFRAKMIERYGERFGGSGDRRGGGPGGGDGRGRGPGGGDGRGGDGRGRGRR